jgi:hypothetical protein
MNKEKKIKGEHYVGGKKKCLGELLLLPRVWGRGE